MNYQNQRLHCYYPFLAETRAHFTLHAFLMSPILRLWHRHLRNTGLTPEPCAHRSVISNPSQLKD
ncbi:hypothetical protein [Phytobacter massiliensis]|uniref:protein YnhH n=1 Tax=Phytobacter massiliensis TaxID=1485952 RepID=UPI003BACD2D3